MGKRKIFLKTDLEIFGLKQVVLSKGDLENSPKGIIPENTVVNFPRSALRTTKFDFGPWYGMGFDSVTYACQKQIERFLDKQDSDVQTSTIVNYCTEGLVAFF